MGTVSFDWIEKFAVSGFALVLFVLGAARLIAHEAHTLRSELSEKPKRKPRRRRGL